MPKDTQKPELPAPYKTDDLRQMIKGLELAAAHLESALELMTENGIEDVFFRLDSVKNHMLQQVVDSCEDAQMLAKREVAAKESGITSRRTESVMRHYKAALKKWEASQQASQKPKTKDAK